MSRKYEDDVTEWKFLACCMDERNKHHVFSVKANLFTDYRATVFRAIQECYNTYTSFTYEGLAYCLKASVPGELTAASFSGDVVALKEELIRLAKKRLARDKSQELLALSEKWDITNEELYQTVEIETITANRDTSLTNAASNFLSNVKQRMEKKYTPISTGLRFLDARMRGEWMRKKMSIIAAAPGCGKTTLIAQSIYSMASRGHASLFISLEATKEDLMEKWAAALLEIDSAHIGSGNLTKKQFDDLEKMIVQIQKLPIYIVDTSAKSITVPEMLAEIKHYVRTKNIAVVFIDYLQLINYSPTGMINYDMGEVAQIFYAAGKDADIHICMLSQINGKDGTEAIRGSGEVRNIVDFICILRPDGSPTPGNPIVDVIVEIPKNRLGATGQTSIVFNGPFQRFEEAAD